LGAEWKDHIAGYFLLIDYTDSTMTKEAVEKGQPWFIAKGQDRFLVLSENVIPAEKIEDPHKVELELKINGETKQHDLTGNMHYKIWDQLDYISKYLTLDQGDMLMTGTPEGMGPVNEGDKLEAQLRYQGKVLAEIKDTIKRSEI
jgi:2-keto-4-pentenoate hydratase/2-oxohepta-3-ene-1,7-dioic acid hydratase in catechol pathway